MTQKRDKPGDEDAPDKIFRRLTPKQKAFADLYLKSGSATQAYIEAGYTAKDPHKIAYQLLRNAKIKAYIQASLDKLHNKRILSAEQVLEYLSRVVAGKEKEDVVAPNSQILSISVAHKDRISAAKELLKRYPDPLTTAQIHKILADTELSKAKTKQLADTTDDTQETLTKLLNAISDEDKKEG